MSRHRPRVLFVAEAVTLAHVGRASALAQGVDARRFEAHVACDPRCVPLLSNLGLPLHAVTSLDPVVFAQRLREGDPLYATAELRSAVREDLKLISHVRPQAVVGDMRVSLGIAARAAGIPYATVANAHWSPYARSRYVVPELAIVDRFGPGLGQLLFDVLRPLTGALQVRAFNRVRCEHGLASIRPTLAHLFTDADRVWYADVPALVPTFRAPAHHHYLGPLLWSPVEPSLLPEVLPQHRPLIYVSMGSSGPERMLAVVFQAMERMRCAGIVSTAGKGAPRNVPEFIRIREFLPGLEAARLADLVVCNGGSATVYQAMAAGKPVLGLPNNLDQYLMMEHVERKGVGRWLRTGTARVETVAAAMTALLDDPAYRVRVREIETGIRMGDGQKRLDDLVEDLLQSGRSVGTNGLEVDDTIDTTEGGADANRPSSFSLGMGR
ncbi:PGL/p-HBAD biosynthesis glycosyltransferase [Nitrospira sp.]|nr:PGL/p-HBAD biosynthesis glycosyltransferase [Nitrospira sp.]